MFQLSGLFATILSRGVRDGPLDVQGVGRHFQTPVQTPFCPFHLISTFFFTSVTQLRLGIFIYVSKGPRI